MSTRITAKIAAKKSFSYPVWIDQGVLNNALAWMPENISTVVIITDNTVKNHYGDALVEQLRANGYSPKVYAFSPGEASKSREIKARIEDEMLEQACDRRTLIIALGGGVTGDLAGFIAATYMRGIAWVQIPTTLLAMVDSSMGGKTGVDTRHGKNLIGAYWQPRAVISDINCLKTLPQEHIINGLVEALKTFLVRDARAFKYFKANLDKLLKGDGPALKSCVTKSVRIKSTIVSRDECDQGLRMILNLGHTIGHALEQVSGYAILHGHAVAYGLLVEAKMAVLLGVLTHPDFCLIEAVLLQLGFKGADLGQWDMNQVIAATRIDKKAVNAQVNYILLRGLGVPHEENGCWTHVVSDDVVRTAYLAVAER